MRIFTRRSLNIYGCEAQLRWSRPVCTVSPWNIPQDFASSFLFMLRRGHATQNARWFTLNTCTASVLTARDRCSLALRTLCRTSGPEAHGISINCKKAFRRAVHVDFPRLEWLRVSYCDSIDRDGDAHAQITACSRLHGSTAQTHSLFFASMDYISKTHLISRQLVLPAPLQKQECKFL